MPLDDERPRDAREGVLDETLLQEEVQGHTVHSGAARPETFPTLATGEKEKEKDEEALSESVMVDQESSVEIPISYDDTKESMNVALEKVDCDPNDSGTYSC